jgi:hypothetical protein
VSSASAVPERVPERFEAWLGREDDGGLALFRRVFAGIWLAYDAIDLAWGMTERSRMWFPHPRDPDLAAVQAVLVVSGAMLVLGRRVWLFGMIAAGARVFEALRFFPLNDFFFVSVIDLLLAHSQGGPFGGRRDRQHADDSGRAAGARSDRAWVRDALIVQFGWIYLATGLLKLNPDWLSGGHIFVRTQYLWTGHGWPYPAPMERALASLSTDAWLARFGAASELTLGVVLMVRRPYWLAAALVLGIHAVGALLTNVWFFSASMIAGVLILLPRAPRGPRAGHS